MFVDAATNTYFDFILNELMGRPNSVLSTPDALGLSDLNYRGAFGGISPAGMPAGQQEVVYRITYIPEPSALVLVALRVSE